MDEDLTTIETCLHGVDRALQGEPPLGGLETARAMWRTACSLLGRTAYRHRRHPLTGPTLARANAAHTQALRLAGRLLSFRALTDAERQEWVSWLRTLGPTPTDGTVGPFRR